MQIDCMTHRNPINLHFVIARHRQRWWFAVLQIISTIDRHFRDYRWTARSKVKTAQSMFGKIRLQPTVDVKVKGETSEIKRESIFRRIVDSWMRRSERRLNLLDGRNNFRRVEMHATVAKTDELHVKDLDGFESLRDRIEDEADTIEWQVDDDIAAERVLKWDT